MRHLILTPILHSQADLGSVANVLREAYIQAYGRRQWEMHRDRVDHFWKNLGKRLDNLGLDWPRVRVYQDGLPVCGKELELVERIARMGSANYQLILKLLRQGARLEGTEAPELLMEEHNSTRQLIQAGRDNISDRECAEEIKRRVRLLEKRDIFIARRIESTLQAGETGLLFIGAGHSLGRHIPNSIRVIATLSTPARAPRPRSWRIGPNQGRT